MAKILQSPRGTRDILADEQIYWNHLVEIVKENMGVFGAERIETPIFEYGEVYTRAIGNGTDIVDKEMFEVRRLSRLTSETMDEEDTKIMVLRPEYTAGVTRAYIQNGMNTWPQPVKLWYMGPNFRYERPQAGRWRIHNQFGLEVIGDADPLTDTLIILQAWHILKKLHLTNVQIDINSIGDATCRPKMKKKLAEYFQNFLKDLCADCNRRFVENPLRILDCKEPKCQKIIAGGPQLIDMLCADCKNHFRSVLENLDSLQIPYNLNPRLVRGLDYYSRTVFEFYINEDRENQLSILGGGRYDYLIGQMGGPDTPACGWAAGVERILRILKDKGITVPDEKKSDIALIHMGEKAKKQALSLLSRLLDEGFRVTDIIGKESLKAQLRSASKMGARIALIIGQREYIDKTIIFKDMDNGSQETLRQDRLTEFLYKKLS